MIPTRLSIFGFLACAMAIAVGAAGQSPDGRTGTPQADEPFVIERFATHVTVSANGSFVTDVEARIRVQSTAAVQEMGNLRVAYQRESDTFEYRYGRVRKPDGTVIETPVSGAIDVPTDVTQSAPMYSDTYIKHLNLRGLAVGDVVDYATRTRTTTTFPGHVSLEYGWPLDAVYVEGEYRLTVPAAMQLTVKAPGREPTITRSGSTRTYVWRFDNPARLTPEDHARRFLATRDDPADLQVTSFRDWAQFGVAIDRLWQGRAAVTSEVRQKALELTKDAPDAEARVKAIFGFVARDIRYVGVEIGIGRLQPRAAAEVLANGYGDCKDKHILLQALLAAVGIESAAALIGPGAPFDADVPSHLQFSHVITFVPGVAGGLWMDATLEVAPPGLLTRQELDRQVLLLPSSGPARLARTPVEAIRRTHVSTSVEGTVSDTGTLTAKVSETYSGDFELVMRQGLRLLPRPQWTDLVARLPLMIRTGGEASDITAPNLEDTSAPLQINYAIVVNKYSEWDSQEVAAALPMMGLPRIDKDDLPNLPLGLDEDASGEAVSRITLPPSFALRLASGTQAEFSEQNSFIDYEVVNRLDGNVFESRRSHRLKQELVPVDQLGAYAAFFDRLGDKPASVSVTALRPWAWNDVLTVDWYEGASAPAVAIMRSAVDESNRGAYPVAFEKLEQLIAADPSSRASAGIVLAWSRIRSGDRDAGLRVLEDLTQTSPSPSAYRLLVSNLAVVGRQSEAAAALARGAEVYPDDRQLSLFLGESLLRREQFADAVRVLTTQLPAQQKSARLQWNLGKAFIGAGRSDDALAAFRAAVEADASPHALNEVAWAMVEAGIGLDEALTYSEQSILETERQTRSLSLATFDQNGWRLQASLGAYWDTRARVLFRLKRYSEAEPVQRAAFGLMRDGISAFHLAQILEASGRAPDAVATAYAIAAVASRPDARAVDTLARLVPDNVQRTELMFRAGREYDSGAQVTVPAIPGVMGRGRVSILLGASGALEDVRFDGGDAALRPAAEMIRAVTLPLPVPPGSDVKIGWRGILTCKDGKSCTLALSTTSTPPALPTP